MWRNLIWNNNNNNNKTDDDGDGDGDDDNNNITATFSHLPQPANAVSSEWSKQSVSPSHLQLLGIQAPL